MKQNQFVRINNSRWQAFEQACNQGDTTTLTIDFPEQYRRICHDLAIAKTRHYTPALMQKLNNLVQQGQTHLYRGNSMSFKEIINIFTRDFPAALYQCRYYVWGSFLAFYGLAVIAYIWVALSPDAIYYFLDPQSVNDLEDMYNPSGNVQSQARGADSDILMFGFYIYNNIGIAFQMIGGGALLGVGALIPLLFNSFYFGAVSAHIVNVGYQAPFFSFVITHGSFELMAIVIAGAAGCKLGFSLLRPSIYARSYALKLAGKQVLPLIIGAFVMLVLAAFIEAFWSPRDIPNTFKYLVGGLGWGLVLYRLYKGTRYGT
ncbi:hypothetical protein C2869_19050 [Saccharobesus litoralis]|uniref:Stage II sporulation protein M n=1 Tax=Saccharobesus litoralis TaxID=2172099 RepID=A0A2S0VW22_9ALTE|nr:stage II sporulation protein M [Saccharobesus litoralis]AWB68372.1 hypothetical protein C2869_19050 [Saccharobesus litoralis]